MSAEILAAAPTYAPDAGGTMVTLPYRRCSADGVVTLLGTVNLRFDLPLPLAEPSGDAAIPLGLLVAMHAALPLRSEAPVSAKLIEGAARYQEIHQCLYPDETLVPLLATTAPDTARQPQPGVGAFLSNGVDSLQAILEHLEEITHFIFIIGFDIWLKHYDYAARSLHQAGITAAEFGRPLIVVETNNFDFAHHYITWPRSAYALQSAIGHLLSPLLGKIIQALDYQFSLVHAGSEFLGLHEALSSETFRLQPACGKYHRQQKLQRLCESPLWLSHLRVCWDMPADRLNCGQCEKCLRTMIGLAIAGATDLCPVLPPLAPAALSHLTYNDTVAVLYDDLLSSAQRSPHLSPAFLVALTACVRRNRLEILAQALLPLRAHLLATQRYQQKEKAIRQPLFDLLLRIDETWLLKKLRRHATSHRPPLTKQLLKTHKPLLRTTQRRALWTKLKSIFQRNPQP